MKSLFFEEEISYYNPNTLDTNCKSIILIEKPVFNGFSMIMSAQNQLPIILLFRFSPHTRISNL